MAGQRVALNSPIVEEPHIGPELLPAGGLIHQVHQIGNLFFEVDGLGRRIRFGKERPSSTQSRDHASTETSSIHIL